MQQSHFSNKFLPFTHFEKSPLRDYVFRTSFYLSFRANHQFPGNNEAGIDPRLQGHPHFALNVKASGDRYERRVAVPFASYVYVTTLCVGIQLSWTEDFLFALLEAQRGPEIIIVFFCSIFYMDFL